MSSEPSAAPIIRIEGLSKRYRVGGPARRTNSLREALTGALSAPLRRLRALGARQDPAEEFWALRNLSLSVERGEVVGVIGRNGAGKTTLLKVLSRITEPTAGRVELAGRVSSLLEVGTGFHPELTGRENIYLNGTIHGMRKREIDARLDEIVAFSEVERFLETPVKRYSSGMYVRLAFAVAAHLEPDILLVDEVLAVGDVSFQKKCLSKMSEVSGEGRTILFVSHNIAAIQALCSRCLVLDGGHLIADAPTDLAVRRYLEAGANESAISDLTERQDRQGDGGVRVTSIAVAAADGGLIRCTSPLAITLEYEAEGDSSVRPTFILGIKDSLDVGLFGLNSDMVDGLPERLPARGAITCTTGPINLTAGRCYVNIAVNKGAATADYVAHAASFDVETELAFGARNVPGRSWALCVIDQEWRLKDDAAQPEAVATNATSTV